MNKSSSGSKTSAPGSSESQPSADKNTAPKAKDLIADMQRVVAQNPDSPITRSFYRVHGTYSDGRWEGVFGTFSNFRRASGLEGIMPSVENEPAPEKKASSEEPSRTDDIKKDQWVVTLPKTNIHTLDQLVAFCEVDLTVWEVDHFICNKWEVVAKVKTGDKETMEREPLYQVKAWFKKKVVQEFILQEIALLKERAAEYSPVAPYIHRPTEPKSGVIVEHALYDHHFGGYIWGKETGHDDYDLPIAKRCWEEAITALMDRTDSFKPDGALFVVGNDLINADNRAGTTEHLTPQSMDSRYQKVYGVARDATVWAIDLMLAKYGKVHVPIVGGNHDPLACWHLGDYLSAWYRNNPNVTVDNAPSFRKWWEHGVNMLMFSHGNKGKLEDYGKTMASEKPEMWGRTKWREAHTGDKHQRRLIEFSGYSVRILPTLRPPCGWTSENMYSSMRAAESYVWSHDEGLVGQASYSILPGRGISGSR